LKHNNAFFDLVTFEVQLIFLRFQIVLICGLFSLDSVLYVTCGTTIHQNGMLPVSASEVAHYFCRLYEGLKARRKYWAVAVRYFEMIENKSGR
jgi:hypothetical protein